MCFCSCISLINQRMASALKKPNREDKAKIESFVVALNKKSINLIALDFDKTFIDIHSGGIWNDPVDLLIPHVRPCMRDLLEIASNKGNYVSIVTFHRQAWLIKDLLHKVLPKIVANKVYIQANTPDFIQRQRASSSNSDGGMYTSRILMPDFNGKEAHITAVIDEIHKEHDVVVKKDEIILMDDDINNVRIASLSGHYAFQVQQNVDYHSFDSFETMLLV